MKIRVVRPWKPFTFEVDGFLFSTGFSQSEADALLCEWAPSPELDTFEGPSAWYTCEPRTNPRMGVLGHRDQRRAARRLRAGQMLHHAHPDPALRVPHVTHRETTRIAGPESRVGRACAIVSNFGGAVWRRWPDIRLRNAFATADRVDLFGRRDKWSTYRPGHLSWPRLPDSHAGEPADLDEKLRTAAGYHACVCLENTCEPHYFTEKFVDAVRAGCVPIYRAHDTVRSSVLEGARWVDPADFDFDPVRTVAYALEVDRAACAEQNLAWLERDEVRATRFDRVWSSIGRALERQR